jgi:dienelactone hydrolase
MDAPGIREELRNMARRIAKHGYFCLLPDMYYRLGTLRLDMPRRDDAMTAVFRAAMNSLTNAGVVDDTSALLAYFDAQDKAKPGPVGCVGHCMSGQYITWGRHHHRQGGFAAPAARQDQGRALLRVRRDRSRCPHPYPRRIEEGARQG